MTSDAEPIPIAMHWELEFVVWIQRRECVEFT